MDETVLACDGVDLCVETFGADSDPALLLVAGGAQSMDWWEPGLCELLAAHSLRVIRYDHRDTGRSSGSPAGSPSYTATDLVSDPLRILDALDVDRAHVLGLSMGGGIVQRLAVEHPERLRTVTVVAGSPAGPGDAENGLPPMHERLVASFADATEPDWSDPEAAVGHRVDLERPYVGSHGFDEPRLRRIAAREVARTADMAASVTNHFVVEGGESVRDRLGEIELPVLVVHGEDDPLFPLGHGEALAREIPDATLLTLPRTGHEAPPPHLWDVVVAAVAAHTARA